jgi:hypothetical protein
MVSPSPSFFVNQQRHEDNAAAQLLGRKFFVTALGIWI